MQEGRVIMDKIKQVTGTRKKTGKIRKELFHYAEHYDE